MKFVYEYRTKDNVRHTGVVCASTKDEAYSVLKAKGIRPGSVTDAPGFFNKLFGKGKRWLTIGVLATACLMLGSFYFSILRQTRTAAQKALVAPRSQIYGDPGILKECTSAGWANVFRDDFGARFLAWFAQPAVTVEFQQGGDWKTRVAEGLRRNRRLVDIDPVDPDEVKKMKRIVNGMKEELAAYVSAGGTEEKYIERVLERQRVEAEILARVTSELNLIIHRAKEARTREDRAALTKRWKEKNELLRDMGMESIPAPDGWEENGQDLLLTDESDF